MKTSQAGIDLIKEFEGFEPKAYKDAVGIWTIGFGHVIQPGEGYLHTAELTLKQGEDLLWKDVARFEPHVNRLVTANINQNQFDAILSFTFNVGPGALASSTLLRKINENAPLPEIEAQFLRWNKAGGRVLNGLTRRRQAEFDLYSSKKKSN